MTPPPPPGRGQIAIVAIVGTLVAAGVAAAVLLVFGDGSGQTSDVLPTGAATVPSPREEARTRTGEASSGLAEGEVGARATGALAGTVATGRYVQAGSFRTVEGAATEQSRLREAGIDVSVVESDQAQDLYPGFQVLLAGPFAAGAAAQATVRALKENGVPSAFARNLSPARAIPGPAALAGVWDGTLERSGSERSSENGTLEASMAFRGDGRLASLDVPSLNCAVDLPLREAGEVSFSYGPASGCVDAGAWTLRPSGDELQVVLLPESSTVIVLGTLQRR